LREKVIRTLILTGLIACTLLTWRNSFKGVFILDDQSDILRNPAITKLWPPSGILGWPPPSQRPVTMLTLAVNHAVGGFSVWGYHAVNLGIHLLAGLLLFGLVRRTLLNVPSFKSKYPGWIAGAVAMVWLVHPLQTESVTYIIQRSESLVGLFHLLVLYSAMRTLEARHRHWWAAVAVLACLVGVGVKESMAVAPLAVVLYDRGFVYSSIRLALQARWRLYLGLAFSWLVLAVLLRSGPQYYAGLGQARYTVAEYVRTQPGVILHYLTLAFWPHPLLLDYGWPIAKTIGEVMPGMIVVGSLLAFMAVMFRKYPRAVAVGLWGFLALAPSSGFLPLRDMAFEHRMYLPLAALVILSVSGVSLAINRLIGPAGAGWWKGILLFALVVPLMKITAARNTVYSSAVGMYGDIVAKRPQSVRGHHNLGAALSEQGRMEEALVHFRRTVEIQPDYAEGYYNMGYIYTRLGRRGEAKAAYRRALQLKPGYRNPAINLAIMLQAEDRITEAESVIRRLNAAIKAK